MNNETKCPQCASENIYENANLWICPECAHEWSVFSGPPEAGEVLASQGAGQEKVTRDSNGNILSDGDSVTVIKELKIKGSSSVVKVGTKVKNIRIIDGDDGHDIACKIDGLGSINLKSEFLKKA